VGSQRHPHDTLCDQRYSCDTVVKEIRALKPERHGIDGHSIERVIAQMAAAGIIAIEDTGQ
jgi:hypothetical protein